MKSKLGRRHDKISVWIIPTDKLYIDEAGNMEYGFNGFSGFHNGIFSSGLNCLMCQSTKHHTFYNKPTFQHMITESKIKK